MQRPALYVVATPIGNLGDLSPRARAVLASVDFILCEDTRHTRVLLEHCGVATPLEALHQHNERARAAAVMTRLRDGPACCALVSDAGTPLISDPGYVLVAAAVAADIPLVTVPGPCAVVAALAVSGLPTDRFVFEGFLPSAAAARARRLAALAGEARTLVFYEAPHRLLAMLEALREALGPSRPAMVARELTKRFETHYRGTLEELLPRLARDEHATRGECVVVVGGAPAAAAEDAALDRTLALLLAETDRKTALRLAMALTGQPRNLLYRRLLALEAAAH